ncbi:MAG: CrcB family protein [Saprospiraceae bacterium]
MITFIGSMNAYLLVFLGGGIGSVMRFALQNVFRQSGLGFTFPTFLANIIACLLLGYLTMLTSKGQMSDMQRFFLGTGICGGFSTFSTLTQENWQLFQNGSWTYLIFYTSITLVVGFIAFFTGMKMA